jgi:hypothetical protein
MPPEAIPIPLILINKDMLHFLQVGNISAHASSSSLLSVLLKSLSSGCHTMW